MEPLDCSDGTYTPIAPPPSAISRMRFIIHDQFIIIYAYCDELAFHYSWLSRFPTTAITFGK